LPEEIEMWTRIKEIGFIDTWRYKNPNEHSIYSWFDYRSRMFEDNPKRGLRIDHILLSTNLEKKIKNTGIDYESRAMEKPSDHCPIWLELK
jgi:exodeoxyribonuclease-3